MSSLTRTQVIRVPAILKQGKRELQRVPISSWRIFLRSDSFQDSKYPNHQGPENTILPYVGEGKGDRHLKRTNDRRDKPGMLALVKASKHRDATHPDFLLCAPPPFTGNIKFQHWLLHCSLVSMVNSHSWQLCYIKSLGTLNSWLLNHNVQPHFWCGSI
jgi:hypothetical protein